MKKLNNKGFAIASILYSIMVLFLILLLSILGILGSRKAILDKNKKDIIGDLNAALENNKFIFEHRDITIVNNGNIDDIKFALMDGVSAVDKNGNVIGAEYINYQGIDFTNIENNKDYNVVYTANNGGNTITGSRLVKFTDATDIKNYSYTGNSQTFTSAKNGSYKVELWGASGGNAATNNSNGVTYHGGNGAYVSGLINLNANNSLIIQVGGKGTDSVYSGTVQGGYNGGGPTTGQYTTNQRSWGTGGGATDVRISTAAWNNFDSLKSRIMVAAGGGGAFAETTGDNGGAGGGLTGFDGTSIGYSSGAHYGKSYGATQTQPGYVLLKANTWKNYSNDRYYYSKFGYATAFSELASFEAGGGGGYYAGANSGHVNSASGGSSFISGYLGCDAIAESSTESNIVHTGQPNHYSGYIFKNGVMRSGADTMPNHEGNGTMTGNSGNGYAKISLIYYYE